MSLDTLWEMTEQCYSYVDAVPDLDGVNFVWHGGEPTVLGLPFFQKAIQFQKELGLRAGTGNFFQTNGLLLNERWFAFFKANDIALSLSIDGPKHVHDAMRVDARGQGSFDRTLSVIEKAQAFGLTPGVVVTITKANKDHVAEIFELLATRGIGFNVIPIVKSGDALDDYTNMGIEPEEWTNAFIQLYDLWYDANPNYIFIDDFVSATKAVITGRPNTCVMSSRNCASFNLSVDPKGDVYPCGWLSGHRELCYGNLNATPIANLMLSRPAINLRLRDDPEDCKTCEWNHICHGGCMAHSYLFNGSTDKRTHYCHTVKNGYSHIAKRLAERGVLPGRGAAEDPLNRLRPSKISEVRRTIPIKPVAH